MKKLWRLYRKASEPRFFASHTVPPPLKINTQNNIETKELDIIVHRELIIVVRTFNIIIFIMRKGK